jgi:hypothetical protein
LFSFEAAQQGLLAQQAGLHAFSFAPFERMHDRAESGIAATGNIVATTSEITLLLSTAPT